MRKQILIVAIVLGTLSIILGAFGAHGLKELLDAQDVATYETGVRYQMYQSIFLLFLSQLSGVRDKILKISFWLSVVGILFFSGSIYGLATNDLTGFDFKTIGFITPIGGLFLIVSWIVLLFGFKKSKD